MTAPNDTRDPWGHAARAKDRRMSCELMRWAVLFLMDLRERGRIGRGEYERHMSDLFAWSME